jgi:hypothetical protein
MITFEFRLFTFKLIVAAQECDATNDTQRVAAWPKKNKTILEKLIIFS